MKKLIRKIQGITLVSLVVTIIILLILAGTAITLTIRRRWNIYKSKNGNRKI